VKSKRLCQSVATVHVSDDGYIIDNTRYAVSDASRAMQSMMLTAWMDGLGSN
jgi:hypothetical protein